MRDVIHARSVPEPNTGCWLWTGTLLGSSGYGAVMNRRENGSRRQAGAHRLSYEVFVGVIPKGLLVLHHCDTPLCVNPDHLYAGTAAHNMRDAVSRGRHVSGLGAWQRRKTHCKRGHEFNATNTLLTTNRLGGPARECRLCRRIRERQHPSRRRSRAREQYRGVVWDEPAPMPEFPSWE